MFRLWNGAGVSGNWGGWQGRPNKGDYAGAARREDFSGLGLERLEFGARPVRAEIAVVAQADSVVRANRGRAGT